MMLTPLVALAAATAGVIAEVLSSDAEMKRVGRGRTRLSHPKLRLDNGLRGMIASGRVPR
jgi:hypothetical protein